MGLEIGLNILEMSWKSFGKSLKKMCGKEKSGSVLTSHGGGFTAAAR